MTSMAPTRSQWMRGASIAPITVYASTMPVYGRKSSPTKMRNLAGPKRGTNHSDVRSGAGSGCEPGSCMGAARAWRGRRGRRMGAAASIMRDETSKRQSGALACAMIVPGGCKVLSATPIRGAQQSYGVNMAWVGVIPLAVGTTGDMPFRASGATRSVTTAPDHGDFPGPILQALAESLDGRGSL